MMLQFLLLTVLSAPVIYATCFIIINQLVLWDPSVNYYSISQWQGSTSNLKHSVSWYQFSWTVLSPLSSYKTFCYHHHFQGTSENCTVCCCIQHGLNISSATGASDSNSRRMVPPMNVFDICSCLGKLFKKGLRLRYFKLDRDQSWQDCSSSKCASIDVVWYSIWCQTFKLVALMSFLAENSCHLMIRQRLPGAYAVVHRLLIRSTSYLFMLGARKSAW